MKRKPESSHRAVASKRNSICGIPLDELDWRSWWTDTSGGGFYLHVRHVLEDTVHRVYCRASDKPRLEMKDGKLFWLIDQ